MVYCKSFESNWRWHLMRRNVVKESSRNLKKELNKKRRRLKKEEIERR